MSDDMPPSFNSEDCLVLMEARSRLGDEITKSLTLLEESTRQLEELCTIAEKAARADIGTEKSAWIQR